MNVRNILYFSPMLRNGTSGPCPRASSCPSGSAPGPRPFQRARRWWCRWWWDAFSVPCMSAQWLCSIWKRTCCWVSLRTEHCGVLYHAFYDLFPFSGPTLQCFIYCAIYCWHLTKKKLGGAQFLLFVGFPYIVNNITVKGGFYFYKPWLKNHIA